MRIVDILPLVARRRADDYPSVAQLLYLCPVGGELLFLRPRPHADRHVCDADVRARPLRGDDEVDGPHLVADQRRHPVFAIFIAIHGKYVGGHQLNMPVGAGDADTVAADGADDPSDMRAVAVNVADDAHSANVAAVYVRGGGSLRAAGTDGNRGEDAVVMDQPLFICI